MVNKTTGKLALLVPLHTFRPDQTNTNLVVPRICRKQRS